MRKLVWITGLSIVLSANSYAVDLDSPPAPKKITIRSEIDRGKTAAFSCYSRDGMGKLYCIGDVLSSEKKNNTDTEAFQLGAKFIAWSLADIFKKTDIAVSFYKEFRKTQIEYDIDDKTLSDLCGLKYDPLLFNKYKEIAGL